MPSNSFKKFLEFVNDSQSIVTENVATDNFRICACCGKRSDEPYHYAYYLCDECDDILSDFENAYDNERIKDMKKYAKKLQSRYKGVNEKYYSYNNFLEYLNHTLEVYTKELEERNNLHNSVFCIVTNDLYTGTRIKFDKKSYRAFKSDDLKQAFIRFLNSCRIETDNDNIFDIDQVFLDSYIYIYEIKGSEFYQWDNDTPMVSKCNAVTVSKIKKFKVSDLVKKIGMKCVNSKPIDINEYKKLVKNIISEFVSMMTKYGFPQSNKTYKVSKLTDDMYEITKRRIFVASVIWYAEYDEYYSGIGGDYDNGLSKSDLPNNKKFISTMHKVISKLNQKYSNVYIMGDEYRGNGTVVIEIKL